MTLYELGMEYLQQDVALRQRVAQLKQKLPQLRGEESREMEARIRGLYEMARDCRLTGQYLIHYYDKEEPYGSMHII